MEDRLAIIAEMSPAIRIHVVAALAAAVLGAFVLFRRKGDRLHRINGRIWVVLMLVVAISSFWIHTIRMWGAFSPIHLLSIYTLGSLAVGLGVLYFRARLGIKAFRIHEQTMQGLYAGALLIAGGFTFLPSRVMGKLFFGPEGNVASMVTLVVLVSLGVWLIARANGWIGRRGERSYPYARPLVQGE